MWIAHDITTKYIIQYEYLQVTIEYNLAVNSTRDILIPDCESSVKGIH